jgi:hypothetical protein
MYLFFPTLDHTKPSAWSKLTTNTTLPDKTDNQPLPDNSTSVCNPRPHNPFQICIHASTLITLMTSDTISRRDLKISETITIIGKGASKPEGGRNQRVTMRSIPERTLQARSPNMVSFPQLEYQHLWTILALELQQFHVLK